MSTNIDKLLDLCRQKEAAAEHARKQARKEYFAAVRALHRGDKGATPEKVLEAATAAGVTLDEIAKHRDVLDRAAELRPVAADLDARAAASLEARAADQACDVMAQVDELRARLMAEKQVLADVAGAAEARHREANTAIVSLRNLAFDHPDLFSE